MSDSAWKANARRLKAWRAARPGLSQEAAAEMVGATQKSWDAWEDGLKAASLSFAFKLEALTEGAVPATGWARRRAKPRRRQLRSTGT